MLTLEGIDVEIGQSGQDGRNEEKRQDVKAIMHLLVRGPCCVLLLSCVNNQVEFLVPILFITKEEAEAKQI